MSKKKVLYAASKYSYANPERELSYEHYNFLDSIKQINNIEVREFDWVTILHNKGRDWTNQKLLREVSLYKPDLVFFSLFRNEYKKEVVKQISNKTQTFAWFSDDISRFESYIRNWAPLFSWVGTITDYMVPRYKKIGQRNVIYTPFACNPNLYKRIGLSKNYGVSLIGQAHSNRRRVIHELQKAGIKVDTWGKGWRSGIIDFEEMIKVLSQSKINLNLTAYSFSYPLGRFLPWFLQPKKMLADTKTTVMNARVFEITCCGGFLLSGPVFNIENFFENGKEMVMFETLDDLIEKAKYYLKYDTKREKIARGGYKRVIKEHTYKKRFTDIFKTIGLL